jgi:hypothetical protein
MFCRFQDRPIKYGEKIDLIKVRLSDHKTCLVQIRLTIALRQRSVNSFLAVQEGEAHR